MICPLGGMGEIGKNMTVIGYGGKYIVVDCGLKFPEEDMLGIDFVIPDVSFLMENRDNILAFIITHGHEDHIGALPFVLPKLNVPVYCTELTAGLIENKLTEACPRFKPRFKIVEQCDHVKIGDFEVEFIELCHSIPDSCALAITTPLGIIFHSGDFKFDTTPTDGVSPDFSALARIGDKGVLLAMVDSTNVERPGFTPSEKCTRETFDKLFRRYKDRRILVATFASNLNRIASIMAVPEIDENRFLMACTKNGIIKKTPVSEFVTNRKTGLIAIKLKPGDELVDIKETTGTANVIIITKQGKCICFSEEDVRPMGRAASGVHAIDLAKDDAVVSMELAEKKEELLVVTQNGFGKRTPVKEYKIQARGGKGLLTYDKAKFEKTGELIGAMVVKDEDEIFLINSDGVIIRVAAKDIARLGRTTQGVRIMKVEGDTQIVTMARAPREDEEPADDGAEE